MIAILGATGVLGEKIARYLLADGRPVVAVTRRREKAGGLSGSGAQVREADLTDRASLARACAGAASVVSSVHAMLGRGKNRSEQVDDAGQRALIDAAHAQGVGHFVLVSVAGASPDHPIDFWRSKYRAEQHLKSSGMPWTIVRPTMFMETHAHMLLGAGILAKGSATIFGSGEEKANYVAARDVARLVVTALSDPRARNAEIDIGGPDNLTRHEIAALYGRLSGQVPKLRHISLGTLRFLSAVIRPLHPGVSRIMRTPVETAALDQTFDPADFLGKYPMELMTLEEFARTQM